MKHSVLVVAVTTSSSLTLAFTCSNFSPRVIAMSAFTQLTITSSPPMESSTPEDVDKVGASMSGEADGTHQPSDNVDQLSVKKNSILDNMKKLVTSDLLGNLKGQNAVLLANLGVVMELIQLLEDDKAQTERHTAILAAGDVASTRRRGESTSAPSGCLLAGIDRH